MSCQTIPSSKPISPNKPIHRHSHPMAVVAPQLAPQQLRSYSLKSEVLPLEPKSQPRKAAVKLAGVCCAAAEEKVPEKQRMRFGSTSSIPAVMFGMHHCGRKGARRSCGGVEEMRHALVSERKSNSSTTSVSSAAPYSCNCCARCNQLMFMYSFASKPRVSNITFSTVTSATGLPTIAAEPSRPRSSSYWKPQQHNHVKECSIASYSVPSLPAGDAGRRDCSSAEYENKLANSRSEGEVVTSAVSAISISPNSAATQNKIGGVNSSSLITNFTGLSKSGSPSTTVTSPKSFRPEQPQMAPKSPAISAASESPPSSSNTAIFNRVEDVESRRDRALPLRLNDIKHNLSKRLPRKVQSRITEEDTDQSSEHSASSGATDEHQLVSVRTSDGSVFERLEMEKDEYLKRIAEWGFPIFKFAERHNKTVLSKLTYAIFKEANLFRIFKLSLTKFFNFFHSLEAGYWDIPYHNKIHAADVLHGTFYLTCHPVRAFVGRPATPPETPEFTPFESTPLPLAQSMSTLELMALYTAAAMHDFDHPGRTNAFLVASEDRKAILYNDRSVLENHHAAESWRLLCQTQNNFIETLDSAETKRFRYLVLEYILATDLKQHFDIIMQFNEKAADIDLTNESDRVLVSQMLIKFADINSPAKPHSLHRQWTERICQEFYEQGDEERNRKMAISPYMDRQQPAVAKLQDSFIAHIVNPLAVALNEAGLLPVLPGLEEPELIINLKHNHNKWLCEIDEEQQEDVCCSSDEAGSVGETAACLALFKQNNNSEVKSKNCVALKVITNGPILNKNKSAANTALGRLE